MHGLACWTIGSRIRCVAAAWRNWVMAEVSLLVAQVTSVHNSAAAFGQAPIAQKNNLKDIHGHGQISHGGHLDQTSWRPSRINPCCRVQLTLQLR